MKKYKISTFFIISFFIFSLFAHSSTEANRLLSLIDYIGGDYVNAVSRGEIINKEEYGEMIEFSSESINIFQNLKPDEPGSFLIKNNLIELKKKIESKEDNSAIVKLSNELKEKLISFYNIEPYPSKKPDLVNGKILFTSNCSACHGLKGDGDGALAPNLVPAPTNFKDNDVYLGLSPFKVFNMATFGIEGTSMPAFNSLSDEDRWDTAFYVLSIGFPGDSNPPDMNNDPDIPSDLKDYMKLATLSNQEIINKISGSSGTNLDSLKYVRNNLLEENSLQFTLEGIASALELYKSGKSKEAFDKSLDAYLNGFEKVEADLFVKDKTFTTNLEGKLAKFRNGIKTNEPLSELEKIQEQITADINKASAMLSEKSSFNSAVLFTNSFSIILREGLEAILIIAAIIAFLSNTGSRKSIKYIHYGWIMAIIGGLITWFLASTIISISGARREIIEGVTSLTAAAVLFYVSYWLISKIEIDKWKDYIKTKVENALSKKSILALATVSFLAVYREAFETVLFYQALIYQSEGNTAPIVWGLVVGLALVGILVFVIFKLALRIPLKYFFSATSLFLYVLCFILVGKGIHELQEAGVIGVTPLSFIPNIDVLGLYPYMETTIPQGIILLAFVFAVFWISFVTREREKKQIAVSLSQISNEMNTMYESFDHIKGHILEWRKCEEIDFEAEELDQQIHEVIDHVNQLQNRLGDFYQTVSNLEKAPN